jgi:hypothetical protein
MDESPTGSEPSLVALVRALLNLPAETGERFADEWKIVRRRIEIVHGASIPRETEPAGAPRLAAR